MSEDRPSRAPVLRLDTYWPYLVTVLADRIARRTTRIVKEHDLNLSQWRVMAAIADVPGRTSTEVAVLTPMDKGIVSRATKALLQMGLVRREASQLDGRSSHLFLTESGQALYATLVPKVDAIVHDLDNGLDASSQEQLTRMLDALIERVSGRG